MTNAEAAAPRTVRTVPSATCPVCGSADHETLHTDLRDRMTGVVAGDWRMVGCRSCGAGRLDPRPADEDIGKLYASYYLHAPPTPNLGPTSPMARLLRALRNDHLNTTLGYDLRPALPLGRILARLVPPMGAVARRAVRGLPAGRRLLDVGCGNGHFVAEIGTAGWHADGIDLDAVSVAAGRTLGLELEVQSVEERAASHPGAYDAVTLSHVVEHVAEPVEFLRSVRTLLRPGGVVWVATPNLHSTGHSRYGASWLGLEPPRHLVVHTGPSLLRTLELAGFVDGRILSPAERPSTLFRYSDAIRAGVSPVVGTPPLRGRTRIAALLASARAAWRPHTAEELVAVAAAPSGTTRG